MNRLDSNWDDLRIDYDLTNLPSKKSGTPHKSYGDLIRLAPDVAMAFPDSDAVNEALRYLIKIGKSSTLLS